MGIDAVAVLRPRSPALLRGVLDPEETSAAVLEDGTVLLSTFSRFAEIEDDADEGRAILSAYGPELLAAHDDPRGVLFYPDICDPRAQTYEGIVAEIGDAGIWVPARALSAAEDEARSSQMEEDVFGILAAREAFERGEPIDPRYAALFEPPPVTRRSASLEDVREQLAALIQRPEVMEKIAAVMSVGSVVILLQRPSWRPLTKKDPSLGVNDKRCLPDGTVVVHTDRGGGDGSEMVALALGEALKEWVDEHVDPRGVPCFPSTELGAIVSARSYEDALKCLGAHVTFVRPHTIDDVLAERKQRFRDYLEGEES